VYRAAGTAGQQPDDGHDGSVDGADEIEGGLPEGGKEDDEAGQEAEREDGKDALAGRRREHEMNARREKRQSDEGRLRGRPPDRPEFETRDGHVVSLTSRS